jgi:hypothetical protein
MAKRKKDKMTNKDLPTGVIYGTLICISVNGAINDRIVYTV